ncbi:MAG TPA: hypothetical protein VNW51_05830, partial [Mucilaginibacter sp.]|nr:hypothetical protein [Mucilaginibacter sp.]
MKLKYTYTLFTLIMVLYFVPVNAQKSTKGKKATTTKKTSTTKKTKPQPAAKKQVDTKSLGDQAAKSPTPADTEKGGSANAANGQNGGSLSEEIVITSAYKPLLADAVKIRRNPDLTDKTPYKAPLSYSMVDKRLEQNSEIKQLDAMKMPPIIDTVPYNNIVRIGLGNLKTTFAEGYFGNGQDQAMQVAGYVRHFAQSSSTYTNQKSNKEEVGVYGKNIGETNTLSGRIDYMNKGNYFYGYDLYHPP